MSLLLVVALALSTTVRVGRPFVADAGRDTGRAVAVMPQTVERPARRATCERPSAPERAVFRAVAGAPALWALPTGDSRRVVHLREPLLDLPPPAC